MDVISIMRVNMKKIHGERNWKSLFLKYGIYDDRIRIQSMLPFYCFDISYDNVEKIEVGSPPVIWDVIKRRY